MSPGLLSLISHYSFLTLLASLGYGFVPLEPTAARFSLHVILSSKAQSRCCVYSKPCLGGHSFLWAQCLLPSPPHGPALHLHGCYCTCPTTPVELYMAGQAPSTPSSSEPSPLPLRSNRNISWLTGAPPFDLRGLMGYLCHECPFQLWGTGALG